MKSLPNISCIVFTGTFNSSQRIGIQTFKLLPVLSCSGVFNLSTDKGSAHTRFCISSVILLLYILMKRVFSTGSCWYNGNQKNRRLPPPAREPGQAAAHDGGDDRQRQGARLDRAHLLAVHERGPGAQAEVMPFPFYILSSRFLCSLFVS